MTHGKLKAEGSEDGANDIEDDRALLNELGLTDSQAALFLGKSRQALNGQLGPKKGAGQPGTLDYFKLSDILMLVSAARQTGRAFSAERVEDYVRRTRAPRGEESHIPFELLMGVLLGEPPTLDIEGADTVVFMLPAFADLRSQLEKAARELMKVARQLQDATPQPKVFILASTSMQAKMAGQWLGLDCGENCFGRDIVDHYLPTVLVYRSAQDEARPYVLTESGTFVEAPHFRAPMIAECVRSLLPEEVSDALRPNIKSADGGKA